MIKTKIVFIPDYSVKVRSKEESLEFLKARLEQLKIEGKVKTPEGRCIMAILKHQECE